MRRNLDVVAKGFRFPECPRWHDGSFFFCDVDDGKLIRIDESGVPVTVLRIDHPSGTGWGPDGDLYIISSHARSVLRYRGTDLVQTIDLSGSGIALPNDMVTDAEGGCYIGGLLPGLEKGELPPAPLLYLRPDGKVIKVADGLHGANGMVITPDGRTLIVAETFGFRLTAFEVGKDGALSNRRVWAQLSDVAPAVQMDAVLGHRHVLPDGIALDSEGAVWVANCNYDGGALRCAEGGTILDRINVAAGSTVIALMLAGPSREYLYMLVGPSIERVLAAMNRGKRLYSILCTKVDIAGAGRP